MTTKPSFPVMIQDTPPPPVGLFRRASNLLNTNGQHDPPPTSIKRNGLGNSFRRKLQNFKDRSKLLGNTTARSVISHRAHSKSLSDLGTTHAPITYVHSISEPVTTTSKRHSAQLPGINPLLNLSEPVSIQNVALQSSESVSTSPAVGDIRVPLLLQQGTPMTKVSLKRHQKFVFRLDADLGQIVWESKRHKIIPIENIKEIRSGEDARYYRQQFQLSQDYQDRWLTIIYLLDGNYKTLHLIPATKDVFRMWDKTLRELHAIRQELMRGLGNGEMRQALWEKHYWTGANEDRDHKLTFDEVEKLCRRLNINSNHEDLFSLFKQADSQGRGFLDFDDFRHFVKLLKGRPEIKRLYTKLKATNGDVFDFGVFENFMREKQKSTLDSSDLLALFAKYSAGVDGAPAIMTLESFNAFLLSPDNCAFSDQHSSTWHDMTRPLSEYYISSSHNTYLVGHQLVGASTVEGYIRALLHSCRSVEVDIYDGDQEPMIFHGKTFTSKVSLREVCEAILKYGFVASPYPIIISAEIHCSIGQQDLIAAIMIEVFGERLVRMPMDGENEKEGLDSLVVTRKKIEVKELPSPEQLKGKILLKAKNLELLKADSSDSEGYSTDPSSSASDSDAFADLAQLDTLDEKRKQRWSQSESTYRGQLLKARTSMLKRVASVGKTSKPQTSPPLSPPSAASPTTPKSSVFASSFDFSRTAVPTSSSSKPRMSLALLSLLVYTVGVKCRGLNKKEEYAPSHMFSLSENVANKTIKFGMGELIKHTRTHLVRTYPKGTRLSSTNYEPHRFWAGGMQLVAINWQTFDLGYMINHAMFQRNGRSGYVLKPCAIRLSQKKDLLAKRTFHSFEVTIISAQQLPRPRDASGLEVLDKAIVDPYVEVTLYVPDWPVHVSGEVKENKDKDKNKKTHETLEKKIDNEKDSIDTTPPTSLPPPAPPAPQGMTSSTPARSISSRTRVVKKNGFNPVWEEKLRMTFDCVGDMMDLVFVRFVVRQADKDGEEPLAVYCASLGSLQCGYRHLPLHDSQLSQYLFSTLFVKMNVTSLASSP